MPVPEVIELATAREFIEKLRPSHPMWLQDKQWSCPWIFRGQREAGWDLTPAAWRPEFRETDDWILALAASKQRDVDSLLQNVAPEHRAQWDTRARELAVQLICEWDTVAGFAALLNEIGHPIPGEYLGRFSTLLPEIDACRPESLNKPFHPAFALAQHHGVATRLLDWTANPLVAAFFAADEAILGEESDRVAVWALDIYSNVHDKFRAFSIPRFEVSFLHAQHGLFTYHVAANFYYLVNGKWPQMEDCAEEGTLRQITLPKTQVADLKRLLWAEGVSRAHLMPTPDNVTKALRKVHRDLLDNILGKRKTTS